MKPDAHAQVKPEHELMQVAPFWQTFSIIAHLSSQVEPFGVVVSGFLCCKLLQNFVFFNWFSKAWADALFGAVVSPVSAKATGRSETELPSVTRITSGDDEEIGLTVSGGMEVCCNLVEILSVV